MSEQILQMQDLCIAARTQPGVVRNIVDGVDLVLRRGEVLGLIGESGAGKSTIGLAALGFTRSGCALVDGEIRLDEREITGLASVDLRRLRGRRVAYISQSAAASFNPAKTLLAQVCEGPIRHGLMSHAEARRLAVELFSELDLPSPETFGDRYPHQVSGGQLQRAMAAMAMSCRPDVLILDEPTTALDVTTQIEVLAAIRKLIRDHHTAGLYITHDLAVVAQLADRIMVLRDGRALEVGDTSQVLHAPRNDYTRRLIATRTAAVKSARTDLRVEGGTPLISIDGVSARYDKTTEVLKSINLNVYAGETVAVVGESGSGKTSLARVICGLLPCQAGQVRFNDEMLPLLRGRSRDQLRRIQMVYQTPDVALNPRQTVLDIVGRPVSLYFGRRRRVIRDRVEELLSMIDLPASIVSRRPGELSGGQQQRVAIARALAAEPDLVICDEITSALDQLVAEEILRLLDRLQQETNVAFLFITHDLGTVQRIGDRVAVMQNGSVVAEGQLSEVFAPPHHPYVKKLLSAVPELRVDWLDDVLRRRSEGAVPSV